MRPGGFREAAITYAEWQYTLPAQDALAGWYIACDVTSGILPSVLRASLRLFKIAPGDFEQPLGFIARLTVLVPSPRVNRTRFHGVFVPKSQHRALVTPAKRGKGNQSKTSDEPECQTPDERIGAMTPDRFQCRLWAQRLKRVFNIKIKTCTECVDYVKVIACIEEPEVIKKIFTHLKEKATSKQSIQLHESSALPQAGLFD